MTPPSHDPPPPGDAPPALSAPANPQSGSARRLFASLLSLYLALFLAAGVVSVADDSLALLFGFHVLTTFSGILFFVSFLATVLVYILIGVTPMVPKRVFLPVTLFYPAVLLVMFPVLIYWYDRVLEVDWITSCGQVIVSLWVLHRARGRLGLRWPLVPVERLGDRNFSWLNLSVFAFVNVFALLPAAAVYVFFCAALAVNHFSEGFMALRPNGFSVQVRKYIRNDGKTIELFPMAHVADARFYRSISQQFPTNSIVLMEGVTDDKNLLTNKISYQRIAKSLGLSEQHQAFTPRQGEIVDADVDVDQFTPDTIDFLNLVMLVHARGLNVENLGKMLQYSPPAQLYEELINDLLRKRNQHLTEEIQSHLSESDNIMVPWGVAHMPGIARAIEKAGFRLDETREYTVIQFHRHRTQTHGAGP